MCAKRSALARFLLPDRQFRILRDLLPHLRADSWIGIELDGVVLDVSYNSFLGVLVRVNHESSSDSSDEWLKAHGLQRLDGNAPYTRSAGWRRHAQVSDYEVSARMSIFMLMRRLVRTLLDECRSVRPPVGEWTAVPRRILCMT
jgi:hypothetical protein